MDPPQKGKPVGIWIRVSTLEQAEGDSPEHHERRARMYAEAKGWDVREVYHLEAVSGKSVMKHPEAERMLGHVRSGRISGLIFSKLARLARNTRELLDFADGFREHGADLISLQESIDTSTPAGRLFYTMIAAMAQWEREEIAERVAASVKVRAELGKSLGGAAPFGYRWEDGTLRPDPEEAPVRRRMYELFMDLGRVKAVAHALNEAGHRTRRGAAFSDTTVRRLLTDPTAKGWRRANHTRSRGDGLRWDPKAEEEWVWHRIEAIVSEEIWEQVNQILEERRRTRSTRRGRRPVHLFAGVTVCHCGTKMYVPSNTPKYVCRSCRHKIPIEDLEAVFEEQLKAFFLSPELMSRYLEHADETIKDREDLRTTLERESQEVEQEREKVYRAYVEDRLTTEAFGERYNALDKRLRQLHDEIPRIQGEIDFLKIQYLSADEILSEAQTLYGRWRTLTFQEKRQIVEHLVQQITIHADEVEIELAYLPPTTSPSAPPTGSPSGETVSKRQRSPRGSWRPPARSAPGTGPARGLGRR